MDFLMIGILILTIVAIVLIFKFIKHLLIAIALTLVLLFLILAGIGFAAFLDVQDFQKHANDKNLLILEDNDKIISAISLVPNAENEDEKMMFLQSNSFTKPLDYNSLHNSYYKIVEIDLIVSEKIFSNSIIMPIGEEKDEINVTITKEMALQWIRSSTPVDDALMTIALEKQKKEGTNYDISAFKDRIKVEISKELKSDDQFKTMLAGMFIANKASEDSVSFVTGLLSEYKKGNVKVDKKTTIFRIVDAVPTSLVITIIEKFTDKSVVPDENNDNKKTNK
ncbi:MAG: hypothetical protein WC755_00890 [Candidatus Woesearchaeota archaeon]|jgi:hypothetical protein